MTKKKSRSQTSFLLSMIGLGFFAIGMVLVYVQITTQNNAISPLIGLFFLISAVVGLLGLIKSIGAIQEPSSAKKWIGLLVNLGLVIFLLTIILINIGDVLKVTN